MIDNNGIKSNTDNYNNDRIDDKYVQTQFAKIDFAHLLDTKYYPKGLSHIGSF